MVLVPPPDAISRPQAAPQSGLATAILAGVARAEPTRPAILAGDREWTYAELAELTDATARRLLTAGLRPGDRIALLCGNSPEFLVALLGILAGGGIAVPLSPTLTDRGLASRLRLTDPAMVVTDGSRRARSTRVQTLEVELEAVRADTGTGEDVAVRRDRAEAPAMVVFTSGSTGEPKGAILEHRHLLWNAQTLRQVFGFTPGHRDLVISSLSHSGALQRALATLAGGGTVVLSQGRVSIARLLGDAATYAIQGFYAAPPLARYLLETPADRVRRRLASCRTLEIGSAPIGGRELRRLLDLLPRARLFVHYGLTESSRAAILDCRAHPTKLDTVGRAAAGVEITILDDAGRELAAGERGLIALRGRQTVGGYWGENERSARRWVNGRFLTGDYGSLDEDGFLTYLGREDDRINSAGHSFFPAEVEIELQEVEGVESCLAIGIRDPLGRAGEVVCALVVVARPDTWRPEELQRRARSALPPHMVPRRIVVVPEFLLTDSGKPDRRRMLERFAPGLST